jgi:hypothetical protein
MALSQERQKLILLANKSPYGWKTVLEYKHHDLAADEEDEKKIYRAESRAARNKKRPATRGSRRSNNTTSPQQFPLSQSSFPPASTRTSSYSGSPRSPGLCFACGKPGHWRVCCSNTTSSSMSLQSQPNEGVVYLGVCLVVFCCTCLFYIVSTYVC